jgi:hypothetical protein
MYYVKVKDSKQKYGPFGTIKECNWWIEREVEAKLELFPNDVVAFINYDIVKGK